MGKTGTPSVHGGYAGGREQPLHYIWRSMMSRCYRTADKDFLRYGLRGITVCQRWHTYENFMLDMGTRPTPRHSIERLEVNGNYEPDNCIWATASTQQRNKRTTKFYDFDGETGTLVEWAERLGISKELAHWRFKMWGGFIKGVTWHVRQNQ